MLAHEAARAKTVTLAALALVVFVSITRSAAPPEDAEAGEMCCASHFVHRMPPFVIPAELASLDKQLATFAGLLDLWDFPSNHHVRTKEITGGYEVTSERGSARATDYSYKAEGQASRAVSWLIDLQGTRSRVSWDISVDGEQLVQVATQDVTVAPVPCEMVALFPGGKCIDPEAVYVKSLMLSRPLWKESFARLQRRLDSGAWEPPPALGSVPDGLRWCTAEEDPTPDFGRRFCKEKE